jgi:threonine dehydrogenase-like Zn-dependent dehydrogenase
MKGITVRPGVADSVRLEDLPEPEPSEGPVLIQTLAVGICGTDREILEGRFGAPPPGRERLVIGHESVGRVLEAPPGSGLEPGDLVAAIVRRPDPVPCEACAVGEWDMCRNGRYTECGIRALDGFCRERFRVDVPYAVPVARELGLRGVLMEPASILAKAWEQIDRIGARSHWRPRRVLVLGPGPIGLLAALCAVLRGLEVYVLGLSAAGVKPRLVEDLGATYVTGDVGEACADVDVLLECTGVPELVFDAMRCVAANGIVCLTGISSGKHVLRVDAAALNDELVLENNVVFGSVNANRRHYDEAARVLARADPGWLERLITRRIPLRDWEQAFVRVDGDVKTVLQFADEP